MDGLEREQYDGYSAIGKEILEQAPERPAAVVVPVGNGALIGGIGIGICEPDCDIERIGVVAKAARAWPSPEAGQPVECDSAATFADGLAVRVAIARARGARRGRDPDAAGLEREIAHAVGAYADSPRGEGRGRLRAGRRPISTMSRTRSSSS